MDYVLEQVCISAAIHVDISVGGEVKDSTLWCSEPAGQFAITEVLVGRVRSNCNSKEVVPWLLRRRLPLEPTAYGILLREHSLLVANSL